MVDPVLINQMMAKEYFWQLVYIVKGESHHIAGQRGLFQLHPNKDETSFTDLSYIHQGCDSNLQLCIALAMDNEQIRNRYSVVLYLLVFMSVTAGAISYFGFRNLTEYYYSTKQRVKRGYKHQSFYCLYQPIVELHSCKVIGCEVLARYKDQSGELYPDQFIPQIKDLNLTWQFTRQIIDKALEDLERQLYELKSTEGFKINFNIFPCDIESGAVLDLLERNVFGSKPFEIALEIIEDEKLTGETNMRRLTQLSQKGFHIVIDDFGTGYSNLNQIKKMSCDTIKIDRSFINEMEDHSIRSTLIPHIVDIANKLNVSLVAEGIENSMQHQALMVVGVSLGQGYYFGRPMEASKLFDLIEKQNKELSTEQQEHIWTPP